MVDHTYQPKVYIKQGGAELIVASGGKLTIEAGGTATGIAAVVVQTALADLAGSMTGTVDGTIADVAAVSTAGGNTYADSAINTAITSVNLQLKELQTKLNATLAKLRTAGVLATS